MRTAVLGTGRHLPERVVTNDDLAEMFETSDEWIRKRSGVETRRYAPDGVGPAEMAEDASRKALDAAGMGPDEVDAIIFCTLSPDYYFPGSGVLLGERLDLAGTPAFDVRNQCSGFLFGLQLADSLVRSGTYGTVLLACAERHSAGLDFSDRGRHVTVLFGDGAGALVLGPNGSDGAGILSVHLHADGEHAEKLMIQAPTARNRPHVTPEMVEEGRIFPRMDGRFVFKHAVTRMPEAMEEALEANDLERAEVDHFFPHQANLRINEAVAKHAGLDPGVCHNNIQRYGNMSAASIPVLLDETVRTGKVEDGDLCLMAAFGSGFTWGAALLRWGT